MANEVFDFLWSVPQDGYRWVEAVVPEGAVPGSGIIALARITKTKKAVVLTDGLTIGTSYVQKQYGPLQMCPGLFRTFSEVAPTEEGIRAFANEYGNLGLGVPIATSADPRPQFLSGMQGEKLWDWVKNIYAIRRAITIWDMVRVRDVSGLSRYIRWKAGTRTEDDTEDDAVKGDTEDDAVKSAGRWVYESHRDVLEKGDKPPPGFLITVIDPVRDLFKPGDTLMPAQFLVQRWVNKHLREHVSPGLLYDLKYGKPMLRIVPKNLLGAMWLQLAQAIDGNRDYRTCKECGKWFEVSSDVKDGRTARRVFCSDVCKSRDYRQRKEQARQLREEGKSLKEIAEKLGTDASKVRKWVAR